MRRFLCAGVFLAFLCPVVTFATLPWARYASLSDDWYRSEEAKRITANVLSWQSVQGSWPKNNDTTRQPFTGDPNKISGTFDNDSTTGELRFLAREFRVTQDKRCEHAFLKGLDHILKAQYPSGGWPQFYPPSRQYHRHITFNDGSMIHLMELLTEVTISRDCAFVDAAMRTAIKASLDRGLACILKCQIRVNGRLTVWCAQHDEVDYSPAGGRTYELVSLSGAESAGILHYLMSLDNPDANVVQAIKGGAEWYESAKITGIRLRVINGDRTIVQDPNAPPLWARFYEIETNRPMFSGRDGVKKYAMSEIEAERRNGYAWYGPWGTGVASDYAKWKEKQSIGSTVAADGSGQFKTVQEAINAAPTGTAENPSIIRIKPGMYKELLYIQREKRFLRLIGEDAAKTILTYNLNANLPGSDGRPIGTFRTPSTFVDADDFTAENVTFENSAGPVGQALAIRIDGDRIVFRNCRFLGWQDTILANRGRHYFENCTITGHVDFIFGGATAFFEKCHIHCLRTGYITAASTPDNQPYGYVFSGCKITGESPDVKTYLGRPWRDYAAVAFVNTEMSEVVRPEGWHNWSKPQAEKTARYSEFNSTGPGASPQSRVPWARPMTEEQAKALTPEKVLAGSDGWKPTSDRSR